VTDPVYRAVVQILLVVFRAMRLDVRGVDEDRIPAEGGAVFAITHFGYLEFAFMGKVVWTRRRRYVRFMATAVAFRNRVAGPLLRGMKHIPVDRQAGGGAYSEAIRRLRAGELVGVFPEAQVNRAWVVGECKTGAVRMAAEAGVPLIPVAVWGGHRVITRGHRATLRERLGNPVRVHVGEPMTGLEGDAAQQTCALRTALQELVDAAQKTYPEQPVGDPWWVPRTLGGSAPTPDQAAALDAADTERRSAKAARATEGRTS
jgi:1-acyl-sn-glycerol-3-phosphate acyltransferase